MEAALVAARLVLAGTFVLAAFGKLADRRRGADAVAAFGVPERLSAPAAALLPFAELAVAAALVEPVLARWGAVGAIVLLGAFTAAMAVTLVRGQPPNCNCFGTFGSGRVGWEAIARNLAFAAVAVFVLLADGRQAGTRGAGIVMAAAVAAAGLALRARRPVSP